MEISALTLRVLLLFFPGVLCAMLVHVLTRQRDDAPARFLTSAFVLGMSSYLLLYLGRELCDGIAQLFGAPRPLPMTFFAALMDEKKRIASGEIALAAVVAVPLAAAVSAAVNHKLLQNLARRMKVTRRFSEPDVWTLLFNSPDLKWVIVRDLGHDLTFRGWVEAFSDRVDGERSELLLKHVTVYRNSSGAKLYETGRVYLARPREALVLEPGLITVQAAPGGQDEQVRHPSTPGGEVRQGRAESGAERSAPGVPPRADGDSVPDAE